MPPTKLQLEKNKNERLGLERKNKQGSVMKIIKYENTQNIIIEFQDNYKFQHKTTWNKFLKGEPRNPYYPTIYNVAMPGITRCYRKDGKYRKEYVTWYSMIRRCYDLNYKIEHPTYKDVTCCEEWLLFDNFFNWIINQENYEKWLNNKGWNLEKDIIKKGNKIYSPETCCLVPKNINLLFVRNNKIRNDLPIGVSRRHDKKEIYFTVCSDPMFSKTNKYVGSFLTIEDAFKAYKKEKENVIKNIAKTEFENKNITKKCFDAMMNYEVEITD